MKYKIYIKENHRAAFSAWLIRRALVKAGVPTREITILEGVEPSSAPIADELVFCCGYVCQPGQEASGAYWLGNSVEEAWEYYEKIAGKLDPLVDAGVFHLFDMLTRKRGAEDAEYFNTYLRSYHQPFNWKKWSGLLEAKTLKMAIRAGKFEYLKIQSNRVKFFKDESNFSVVSLNKAPPFLLLFQVQHESDINHFPKSHLSTQVGGYICWRVKGDKIQIFVRCGKTRSFIDGVRTLFNNTPELCQGRMTIDAEGLSYEYRFPEEVPAIKKLYDVFYIKN